MIFLCRKNIITNLTGFQVCKLKRANSN